MSRARLGVLLITIVFASSTACGSSSSASRDEILVFAAASLTESFSSIGHAFERAGQARVRFNFGPSDGLATGIRGGAPADVFASASERWVDTVAASPGVEGRAVFARNRLVVIVPPENPGRIAAPADLTRTGLKLVLAAPAVPAGHYAREFLARAGLTAAERNVVSNEDDVKGVVQKVILGEADAGVVYSTDMTGDVAARVTAIPIPDALNVVASYPIAVIRGTDHARAARSFVEFVLGAGREILLRAGFLSPA